ncbi:MAG: lytic murein transglycosylase [Pseudomonadota bacterium]|nr:lytic murein transglycosylase [Pseudomonadota bacterium]
MRRCLVLLLAITFFSFPLLADDVPLNSKPFGLWLQEFEQEAKHRGISQATLDDAFADTAPLDRVIELDRKQPESVLTLDEYVARIVTPKRIREGRAQMAENRAILRKIGKRYGVQPRFIVALWGIETGFGHNIGGFRVIDALATLAYDSRRPDYFRGELIDALTILQQEKMPADDLEGSWAGALGQCQFMPSTFLAYAVDGDGDGKRNIWGSKADAFASIANYLKALGWKDSEGWGREVDLPDSFDKTLADIGKEKPLAEWRRLGVRRDDGGALPNKAIRASLIFVGEGDDAVPYLVYSNYKSLLKWNRSRYFATAVGLLADKIGR